MVLRLRALVGAGLAGVLVWAGVGLAAAQLPAGTRDANSSSSSSSAEGQGVASEAERRAAATAALERGDFAGALKLLTPLAEQNPGDARVLFDLGEAQDALDQRSAAEATYRRAIAQDGTFLEPQVALGLLLARSGRTDEARTELLRASAVNSPNTALRARAYRALAHVDESKNPAEARDALLSALKLAPETPDDVALAATLAEQAQDFAEAEKAYRRLLVLEPGDTGVTASLARLLGREGKGAEAMSLLETGLAAHPGDPALGAQLVSVYLRQGDSAKALELAGQMHASEPTEASVTRLYARLLSQTGDYAASEPLFAGLRTQAPTDAGLADDDADALIHLQRFAEAEAVLKPAVRSAASFRTAEDFGAAASHLAFAASQNNDSQTVLQAVALRATVLPKSPAILFLEAIARDKLHQLPAAKQLYTEFLAQANGKFPNEEWEAKHRLLALAHTH